MVPRVSPSEREEEGREGKGMRGGCERKGMGRGERREGCERRG